jgi:hypothetical protein
MQRSYYDNLDTLREVAIEAKILLWNCILATATRQQPDARAGAHHAGAAQHRRVSLAGPGRRRDAACCCASEIHEPAK